MAGKMNSKDHSNHLNRIFGFQSPLNKLEEKRIKRGYEKLHHLQYVVIWVHTIGKAADTCQQREGLGSREGSRGH